MAERAKAKAKKATGQKPPKGAQGSRGKVAKTGGDEVPDKGHNNRGPSAALIKSHHEKIDAIETRMRAAKAKLDQIKGEHRSAYAVAKQDGIVVDDFKLARELDKRDHGEVIIGYANVGTYLAAIKSPLATQLELFQDMAKNPPVNPRLDGEAAFKNKETRDNNPHTPGTESYAEWDGGWTGLAAKAELVDGEGQTIQ